MLNIATPDLNAAEWQGVRQALGTVAECGCGDPAPAGSMRGRIGRMVHALSGQDQRPVKLTSEQRAIRDFLCDTGRKRRVAEDHVSTLNSYGYTRAQIEAMALIAA